MLLIEEHFYRTGGLVCNSITVDRACGLFFFFVSSVSHTDRIDWERAQAVLPRLSLKTGYSLGGMESHRQRQLSAM